MTDFGSLNWGAHEIIAVDLEGKGEVIVRVPSFPMCIDRLPDGRLLIDSYHCSRYNQNTGRLNATMFEQVFARALELNG